jgi:GNAT superfamily N-acetyltransferase
MKIGELLIHPLTPDRWKDFETLFGKRGACGGCWCMWFRLRRSDFNKSKGDGNKATLMSIVQSGRIPGLLAYDGKTAVGWCSVAPRKDFPAMERSRIMKPIDDLPVWSVVCFYVRRDYRNRGVTEALLQGAIDYVVKQGGKIIEGYPVEPKTEYMPDVFAFHGLVSAFKKAGFVECERRSETRLIMRYYP